MRSWSRLFHTIFRPRTPNLRRRTISASQSWSRASASHAIESLETRELLAVTPVAGAWTGGAFDQVGLFEDGVWQLDLDGDFFVGDDSPPFQFGRAGDLPVAGDWNGNGIHSVGVYRNGLFILDFNDNRRRDSGDLVRAFGRAGDVPIVGNWNGTGGDDLGIFRNARWALDINGNFRWDGGGGDISFIHGLRTDTPVSGNWNPANLRDGIGLYRDGTWIIDRNENFRHNPGIDPVFSFGAGNSDPFTGDFAGNNTDEVGIVTAGGTPFVRTIPPQQTAAASTFAATTATADQQAALAAATRGNDVLVQDISQEEEHIEALFTRENFQELEQFTLTGMAPRG